MKRSTDPDDFNHAAAAFLIASAFTIITAALVSWLLVWVIIP